MARRESIGFTIAGNRALILPFTRSRFSGRTINAEKFLAKRPIMFEHIRIRPRRLRPGRKMRELSVEELLNYVHQQGRGHK